jgi:hypothetical protein
VLQLHLARAVVPPPRLRAKLVVFSAPLHEALYSPPRASPVRWEGRETLQIPAPGASF